MWPLWGGASGREELSQKVKRGGASVGAWSQVGRGSHRDAEKEPPVGVASVGRGL